MFILTNINIPNNIAYVYDTKDNTNEGIRLDILAYQVASGKLKVHGLSPLNKRKRADSITIPELNIAVSTQEAKEALASVYIKNGVDKHIAYNQVGL